MHTEILNNQDLRRFEVAVSGHLVLLAYRLDRDVLTLTHTEVPAALEGQGLGSKVVRYALDYARRQGWKVVPQCPFVSSFIERHPKEYQELLGSARN